MHFQVIVVTCEEDLQMQRLMEQRGLTERESRQMIEAQMSLESKAKRADFVVENSGALIDTRQQIEAIIDTLSESKFHWRIRLFLGVALGGILGIGGYLFRLALK